MPGWSALAVWITSRRNPAGADADSENQTPKTTQSTMTARGDADIESLRKRTYRPLDVFLLVSILFLFLALSAVVAAVVIVVKRPECFDLQVKDDSGQPAFKVRKVLLGQKVAIVLFCGSWSQF